MSEGDPLLVFDAYIHAMQAANWLHVYTHERLLAGILALHCHMWCPAANKCQVLRRNCCFACVLSADAEAEEAAELTWTTERLQQIGAAVEAAASVAPNPSDATDADAAAAAVDAAAAAALNPLEAAAAAVAGQLTRLVYQAASAAATAGPVAAATTGPVSALYPTVTPRQDLGFTPANLGGVFEGIDLNLMGIGHLAGLKAQRPTQPTSAEDYQLVLGIERVRVPELLYQPAALAGVDQAGFAEVLGLVFQRLPKHIGDAVAAGGAVLTGGNACFAGM